MRNPHAVCLRFALLFGWSALALLGCRTSAPPPLTSGQASQLARQLANEQAQTLYNCQPFHNGPSAQLLQGYWVWHDRQGQGNVDLEATVKFAPDGARPSVNVLLLDSRSAPLKELRP